MSIQLDKRIKEINIRCFKNETQRSLQIVTVDRHKQSIVIWTFYRIGQKYNN